VRTWVDDGNGANSRSPNLLSIRTANLPVIEHSQFIPSVRWSVWLHHFWFRRSRQSPAAGPPTHVETARGSGANALPHPPRMANWYCR